MLSVFRRRHLPASTRPRLASVLSSAAYSSSPPPSTASTDQPSPRRRPRVVFSGIQPTGIPHLGNYFGALTNWVSLQRSAAPDDRLLFSVVGWHALTLPQDPRALATARTDMVALLLAVGIDPARSIIFHQDDVRGHAELAWILNCLTPVGRLQRMTTWKSKLAVARNANSESEVDDSLLNAGLLTYPVLQAADILLYKATHVPVGEDQQQHIELCRDIAEAFNRAHAKKRPFFTLPSLLTNPAKRILSLKDPTTKMSKSAPDPKSRVELTHTHADIAARVRGAVTDSEKGITYDPTARPGTANLLRILAACEGISASDDGADSAASPMADLASRFKDHGALKAAVTDALEEALRGPRAEFTRLRADPAYVKGVAEDGRRRANAIASVTMDEVRSLLGLT